MKKYTYILLSNDSGEKLNLQDAPQGWQETKVNIIRDMTYFGMMKSLSVEFQFVGDGYKFLQRQRLLYGQDADILLRLYQGNTFVFEGKVNMENFREKRKNRMFQVDIIQSSFVQSFQNRENIRYNILNNLSADRTPVEPARVFTATIRDRVLQRYTEFDGVIGGISQEPQIYHHTVPLNLKVNDNPSVQSFAAIEISPDLDAIRDIDYAIFKNTSPLSQTLKIDLSINYSFVYTGPLTLPHRLSASVPHGFPPRYHAVKNVVRLMVMNADTSIDEVLMERIINPTANSTFQGGTFDDSFAGAVVIEPGQYLTFTNERYVTIWMGGSTYQDFPMGFGPVFDNPDETAPMDQFKVETVYNSVSMTILQDSLFPDTESPVFLPHELFTNLIAQITGKDNALYSETFGRTDLGYDADGKWAYLAITKGDLLRGVPLEETQVSTSMRDAYKSYNILNLAAIIRDNNTIQIERKDDMFNRELIADLGDVAELEISSAKEFVFNSVAVGYPKVEYEQDNGRDEFNTEVQYTNSFRGVKNELDLRSVYRADGRGIEEARRLQISITGTKDSRYDDKIFFIDLVNENGVLKSRRLEGINYVGGVINPETVMNARISPGQIMLMWQRYLAIPLHRKDKVYYFQSKDKNSGFQVITDLGESYDGEDLNLSQPAYFLNEMRQFNHPIVFSNLFSILANPFGIVKYTYDGEQFYDHLFEIDAEVETKGGLWRMLGTKATPLLTDDSVDETMNAILYDDGPIDFIKYGDGPDDIILYE